VALVVGSAFAYYAHVVDFGSAEKAPHETVEFFELFKGGRPHGFPSQGAVPDEARRIETTTASGEREVVYVAPTEAGGLCYLWQGLGGGGCDRLGTTPLAVAWWASRHPEPTSGISVHVSARYVANVELHFADGAVLTPPITWVSPPIDKGLFVYVYTPEQREHGRRLISVVALDEDGEVVTRQSRSDVVPDALPPDARTEEKTIGALIPTRSGRAVLWVAPTGYEGRCVWLQLLDRVLTTACVPKGYDDNWIDVSVHPTPETVVLLSSTDGDATALELRYADGDRQQVEPEGRFFLVEIPLEHLEPATQLVEIVRLDSNGDEIRGPFRFRLDTGPSADPCSRALPLPPGKTCP
jgi:hypothetical protein